MITGELKAKVDRVWDAFWSGGIANPIEVIEQITHLLFLRGLDDRQALAENKANALGRPVEDPVFPPGKDPEGLPYAELRWSRLKNQAPDRLYRIMDRHAFPFLRGLGAEGSSLRARMAGVRFTIPTPALLAKVVDLLDAIPMRERDVKGDLYEYMLSKIAAAGHNGQFRTPRHVIALMVAMTRPTRDDVIADPACGTAGFLVAASEYLRAEDPDLFRDEDARVHFHHEMFHGHDFDATMLRIGAMNMALHGVEGAAIAYRDSLAEGAGEEAERYSLILANPPFAGSLDAEAVAKDLARAVPTKKTELLFIALFLRLLEKGGRAAVIVPDGVLFGASRAHLAVRRMLVDGHRLDGVVKLPAGVFRPYAGVSTAILLFTRTDSGGTEDVWFYDLRADGLSLDDKRAPLLPADKLGPAASLTAEEQARNNLPDALARWEARAGAERANPRTAQSFLVPRAEMVAAGYDLSLNRYREVESAAGAHRAPREIVAELRAMEEEIAEGLRELEAML